MIFFVKRKNHKFGNTYTTRSNEMFKSSDFLKRT